MGTLVRHDLPKHLLTALRHNNHTISGSDDMIEPLLTHEPLSTHAKDAIADIKEAVGNAIKYRASDDLGDEHYSFNPLERIQRKLTRRMHTWSLTDRTLVMAFLKTCKAQLESYLEDPHPFGASRTDAVQTHLYVSNGVDTGRQLDRLSETTPGTRDFLQHSRSSGSSLLAPHVVHGDRSIPKHLEVPKLQRQFRCPAWAAQRLQTLFLRFAADQRLVAHYATETVSRGYDSIFLELDWYSLQMAAVGPKLDDSLEQPTGITSYEEGRTERGHHAHGNMNVSENDQPPADASETFEPNDNDGNGGAGLEAVEYHPVIGDRDQEPRPYVHPLERLITTAGRHELPDVGKKLWDIQHNANGTGDRKAWAYLWHMYKLRELETMDRFMRWAIDELDRITDLRTLARHGQELFALKTKFTSNERKLFWAAYHERKAAFNPSPPEPVSTTPAPEQASTTPATEPVSTTSASEPEIPTSGHDAPPPNASEPIWLKCSEGYCIGVRQGPEAIAHCAHEDGDHGVPSWSCCMCGENVPQPDEAKAE